MHTMNKVAKVTLYFWIMKIAATTLGETGGDLMSMTMNVGYAVSSLILLSFFFVTLIIQLSAKKYHPMIYWLVIVSTSTAGTTMSDYMDRSLGLGYFKGSLILVSCLVVILAIWRFSVGTLSVDSIRTRKAEVFYWTAILFSNTLGTALGDFLADSSGLGFLGGAILIGGLLGLVVLAFYLTQINRIILFWIAFVLTRPFGATFGDVLTKPIERGGLNLGTIGSSIVLASILVVFVVWTTVQEKRVLEGKPGGPLPAAGKRPRTKVSGRLVNNN
jgi:uncharacterized membrane-anchored protein